MQTPSHTDHLSTASPAVRSPHALDLVCPGGSPPVAAPVAPVRRPRLLAWMLGLAALLPLAAPAAAFCLAALAPAAVAAQDDGAGDDGAGEDGADSEDGAGAALDLASITVDPSLWVLGFDVEKTGSITLLEGAFKGRVFWYMIYTVENRSEQARSTYLSITAKSDRGKTYSDTYLASVERAVERKAGRPLWGQTDRIAELKGRDPKDVRFGYTTFKPGEKRRCVAVFGHLDPDANRITISVRGLSNDFHLITNDDGSREVEERVYEIEYERPGDPYEINLDPFELRRRGWTKKRVKVALPPSA